MLKQLRGRLQPNEISDGYFCANKSDGRRSEEEENHVEGVSRMQFTECQKLYVEQNGAKWNGVKWNGMLENQKQLSLLLSVLVHTELNSV